MHPKRLLTRFLIFLFGVCLVFCPLRKARADNWEARIYEDTTPKKMVGVDKKRSIFNFYEKKSPLRLRYSYPCVTGQLHGDKQQVNDLRTPEGVYFVEYKIASGLDFREYGGVAYTLNYPNPVDRLRGKTGHGIWIHSKGFGLTPTRGCVAIDLKDIAEIGPLLSPGTPVVLAEELRSISGADNGAIIKLKSLMAEWSKAWESRSEKLFDYYDPDAYSKATENFNTFKQNKERLFKMLTFINIYNREIHALEGPGYWVTWSEQLYRASNLSTEGVRRLYWQKDDKGRFRIVGMEWTPRDLGMSADFQKGQLVAQAPPLSLSDASSEAPVPPRIDMPEQADKPVKAEKPVKIAPPVKEKSIGSKINDAMTASVTALAENLFAVSDQLVPKRQLKIEQPDEITWGIGRSITQPAPEEIELKVEEKAPEKPAEKVVAPPEPEKKTVQEKKPVEEKKETVLTLDAGTRKKINDSIAKWNNYLMRRSMDIAELYDSENYNRLPWRSGVPRGMSLASVTQAIKRDINQPWLVVIARPAKLELNTDKNVVRGDFDQMIISPGGKKQGVQSLWWQKDKGGEFKIVGSAFKNQPLGLEANYLDQVSGEVSQMIEDWRKAWEEGRLDDYISFYAPDATQQGKIGSHAIRKQKESLWNRVKPAQVQLTGIRLILDQQGIRADMNQFYVDNSGREDRGVKTLLLRFDGRKWLIKREDWSNQVSQIKTN